MSRISIAAPVLLVFACAAGLAEGAGVAEGRDIFSYRNATVDPGSIIDDIEKLIPRPPAEPEEAVDVGELRSDLSEAERLFAEGEFEAAAKLCGAAASELEKSKARDPQLAAKLASLRGAADSLARRRAAEAEFAKIDLEVQAVVVGDDIREAVVSGHVLREGMAVGETGAVVLRIERASVVFLYGGYKIRLERSPRA